MHEHEYEHVHYDDDGNEVIEEHKHSLYKMDRLVLQSIGLDIGSSTTHLVFSKLELRRQSTALSSRFAIVKREVIYRSPIIITPFLSDGGIDKKNLSRFIDTTFQNARVNPDTVDTGAVITTGDAARKHNADTIVNFFAERTGNFVCASAGPILEARMASYGSGAVARSKAKGAESSVLNIDVGGGTSKLSWVSGGKITKVAAINVGARLVTVDEQNIILKIERAAAICSYHLGLNLYVGMRLDGPTAKALSMALAQSLLEIACGGPRSSLTEELIITAPAVRAESPQTILFSGGVAEYFYRETQANFRDLGSQLAECIRYNFPRYLAASKVELSKERIRATVIGASQFSVQISGNTIYQGNPSLLPLRNLRVLIADLDNTVPDEQSITREISRIIQEHSEIVSEFALVIRWAHGPAFAVIDALCRGILGGLRPAIEKKLPLVFVIDVDIARLVGSNLARIMNGYSNIVCIDGIQLEEFDYIDISAEHRHTNTVNVVIKSLVFSG